MTDVREPIVSLSLEAAHETSQAILQSVRPPYRRRIERKIARISRTLFEKSKLHRARFFIFQIGAIRNQRDICTTTVSLLYLVSVVTLVDFFL